MTVKELDAMAEKIVAADKNMSLDAARAKLALAFGYPNWKQLVIDSKRRSA